MQIQKEEIRTRILEAAGAEFLAAGFQAGFSLRHSIPRKIRSGVPVHRDSAFRAFLPIPLRAPCIK